MAITTVGRTTIQGVTTVGGFNPATLFSAGEQGVWYDPSDFSTLFQDSAGTTPVTALEQPVGRILDKSGRGNTATQATSANRPVVSARVNLLTYTEDFLNTATAGSTRPWNWLNTTAANTTATTAPNGASTADTLLETTANSSHQIFYDTITAVAISYTCSVYVKANGRTAFAIDLYGTSTGSVDRYAVFDLSTGTVSAKDASVTASITSVGNGWYFCSSTYTCSAGTLIPYFLLLVGTTWGAGTYSYAGDITKGVYIWGADLRPTNQGVGLPVYQRVGAAVAGTSTTAGNADYDANGFPVYLSFDGSNDFLQVASYTMPLINRMTAVGIAENAATAFNAMVSVYPATGNDYNSSTGYVITSGDRTTTRAQVDGATSNTYTLFWTTTPSAIIPASILLEDKQTSAGYLRINGTQVASDTSFTQFSANSNGGLLLGARWLSSAISGVYLNGRIYGVIIRGVTSTANQITGAENWLNQKTAAY